MPFQECMVERAGLMFCLCASLNDIGHVNDRSGRVWWGVGVRWVECLVRNSGAQVNMDLQLQLAK